MRGLMSYFTRGHGGTAVHPSLGDFSVPPWVRVRPASGEERLGVGALDQDFAQRVVAEDLEPDHVARAVRPQAGVELVPLRDRLIVEGDDDVARPQPGALAGGPWEHAGNDDVVADH